MHEHDVGIECNCHNNPLGLPPKGHHFIKIDGVMQHSGLIRHLLCDLDRPYYPEEWKGTKYVTAIEPIGDDIILSVVSDAGPLLVMPLNALCRIAFPKSHTLIPVIYRESTEVGSGRLRRARLVIIDDGPLVDNWGRHVR